MGAPPAGASLLRPSGPGGVWGERGFSLRSGRMDGEWHPVEIYSTFLRTRGYLQVLPGQRLTDEVNRLQDYLELRNTVTEPLLASYPVVSPQETNTTIAKHAIVMVVPGSLEAPAESVVNPLLRKPKDRQHVILNTTAFALSADVHLEPKVSLLSTLQHSDEFLPITRVSAILVTSLGANPHTVQQSFALVNPTSIVSFSIREE